MATTDITRNVKAIETWLETGTATLPTVDHPLDETLKNIVVALGTTSLVQPALVLTGVTAGTVTASKALVVDANKDLASLRNLTISRVLTFTSTGAQNAGLVNFAGVTPGTETTGSLITTGANWIVHSAVGACAGKLLASSSAVTGDYATWRVRGRSDAAVADVYNVASVEGINSSASANINDYANLFGVQGLAQPNAFTQANATNVICGVYSCMDRTGTDAGKAWSMWIDDHSTTNKAANHYLLRMSQNALGGTPVDIDGAITIQTSRLPQLFNFEQVSGFLTTSSSGTFTKTHKVAVKIEGDATQYYVEVGTIA